jgi:hypothetical protein
VADERACIDVPNDGNLVAVEVKLRRLRRAPIGRDLRKLAYDQRFDIWARRLFVIDVGADVSYMRIGKADDLPCIAWISKNFLVARKAGIENDFAAAARDGARGSPVKYAPVFQREDCRSVMNFRQWSLRKS